MVLLAVDGSRSLVSSYLKYVRTTRIMNSIIKYRQQAHNNAHHKESTCTDPALTRDRALSARHGYQSVTDGTSRGLRGDVKDAALEIPVTKLIIVEYS